MDNAFKHLQEVRRKAAPAPQAEPTPMDSQSGRDIKPPRVDSSRIPGKSWPQSCQIGPDAFVTTDLSLLDGPRYWNSRPGAGPNNKLGTCNAHNGKHHYHPTCRSFYQAGTRAFSEKVLTETLASIPGDGSLGKFLKDKLAVLRESFDTEKCLQELAGEVIAFLSHEYGEHQPGERPDVEALLSKAQAALEGAAPAETAGPTFREQLEKDWMAQQKWLDFTNYLVHRLADVEQAVEKSHSMLDKYADTERILRAKVSDLERERDTLKQELEEEYSADREIQEIMAKNEADASDLVARAEAAELKLKDMREALRKWPAEFDSENRVVLRFTRAQWKGLLADQ